MSTVARHVFVRGRVQGVAFRYYARERAGELGVRGWIRNLADGRVEARFEGAREPVASFLEWLDRGPSHADVEAVEVNEVQPEGQPGFEIVR